MQSNNKSEAKIQKHPRVTVEGLVYIHDDDHLFAAPLVNLSKGGLFLSQLNAIRDGAVVKIVVKSEDLGIPFQATGKVVRIESKKRKGTAIEFISLNKEVLKRIETRLQEQILENELKLL